MSILTLCQLIIYRDRDLIRITKQSTICFKTCFTYKKKKKKKKNALNYIVKSANTMKIIMLADFCKRFYS
jgi:hypothetical protein